MRGTRRLAWAAAAVCAFIGGHRAGRRRAPEGAAPPTLDWQPCGTAANVTCATATVPLDYDKPQGQTIKLHLAKSAAIDQAHKIGSLFINFGGPGGTAADRFERAGRPTGPASTSASTSSPWIRAASARARRRSTARPTRRPTGSTRSRSRRRTTSTSSALIAKDQRYIKRCIDLNDGILAHVSTANVARDIDLLRQSLGEQKITYFGYSYGTFLGSTYASMFPTQLPGDGARRPRGRQRLHQRPDARPQRPDQRFERALGRFMQACAADHAACRGFPASGSDPWDAYDALIDKAQRQPAAGRQRHARRRRRHHRHSGRALQQGQLAGPGQGAAPTPRTATARCMKALSDGFYGDNGDGTFDPGGDRYFTIGATEQQYPRDVRTVPVGRPALVGPARALLVEQRLRRAQLRPVPGPRQRRVRRAVQGPGLGGHAARGGDDVRPGHAVPRREEPRPHAGQRPPADDARRRPHGLQPGNSPTCIDPAVEAYVNDGTLPAPGTQCRQDVASRPRPPCRRSRRRRSLKLRPHVAPFCDRHRPRPAAAPRRRGGPR